MDEQTVHPEMEHDTGTLDAGSEGVVEPEGLNAGAVGVIVVGGIVFIIAAMFVAVEITGLMFQEALLESTELTGYPVLEQTQAEAEELLSTYALVDAEAGIYRIPIDRAMELLVEESGAESNESESGN